MYPITELIQYLKFDPNKPLLFTQGFFWVFFLFVLLGYSLVYKHNKARNAYLLAVSLYFYYKCGGILIWLLIFSIVATWLIGLGLASSRKKWKRKSYVALSVCVSICVLLYYKYTYFIIEIWNSVFKTSIKPVDYFALYSNQLTGSHFNFSTIILPVGISFFTFQALSYIIDLYRNQTQPVRSIIDFGFYKSFFPQLVAGPIVRAAGFIPQLYTNYALTSQEVSHALFLILNGLVKKMVVSDFISINFVDRVFDNPLGYSAYENAMAVYGYALQIYCDFSGYTDIAIGLALLFGFKLPLNFNSPYKASSITDFWRRWHISLSGWLRDYLYIPLGGNRKGTIRAGANLLITMLIGGLWHGANLRFVIWGGIHGVWLIVEKIFFKIFKTTSKFRRAIGLIITFHVVCFAWIFFRASSFDSAFQMITRIFSKWDLNLIPSMTVVYWKIFAIIAIAYLIHWFPSRFKEMYRGWFIRIPISIKVIVGVVAIFLIYQFKTSALQPFIYFQF
jgi:alginate O-acetyltransferase complex protein AlgI